MKDKTAMWQTVVARDQQADGSFVYAVKTTGVFCRPSCPSRRPLRENVVFFTAPSAALEAGYRACARCRPNDSGDRRHELVQEVRCYIETHIEEPLTLKILGKHMQMSPFHLQRLFKATTGMTPKQYGDSYRLETMKKQLRKQQTVTAALYEAGYSSSSRLYERAASELGMTPAVYKKRGLGLLIRFAFVTTQVGNALMAATDRGLCFLQFGVEKDACLAELQVDFSAADFVEDQDYFLRWITALDDYLSGRQCDFSVPVDSPGTDFQQAVWRYLRQIPSGSTCTYTQVAKGIGKPKAVRAVASACAANRVAIAIPCHRVVREDGGLAGYRWGLELKEKLLEVEGG